MFCKEHWWLFGKLTPLRAAAPMLNTCTLFSAQKSLDLSEVLDFSYERWQFLDFQGVRTSWGTQDDLWKSMEIAIVTSSFSRHHTQYTCKSWDEWWKQDRTALLSQNVTNVFAANPLVIVDPSMGASDFEMVPFWIHRAPLNWGIESMQSGGVRTASIGWRYHLQHHQQSSGHVYAGCWWSSLC